MKCKWNQEIVQLILSFYSQGHSQRETMEKFGITKYKLEYLAKRYHVTNGRTLSEINREKAAVGAAKVIAKTGIKFEQKMSEQGFDLVGEYQGRDKNVTLKCRKCENQFDRLADSLIKTGAWCPFCLEEERKARNEKILAEREQRKIIRETEQAIRRKKTEEKHNQRFNELHICKVCGQEYTVKQYMDSCGLKLFSNPGYCSKTCKTNNARQKGKDRRKRTGKHSSKHYSRARKLGLPREKGVTLKNLIQKNGLQCQICGMFCDPTANPKSNLYPSLDHIVPLHKGGGHTWDNVQIAHRICNSNKRDYIGKEWNNGDFKEE